MAFRSGVAFPKRGADRPSRRATNEAGLVTLGAKEGELPTELDDALAAALAGDESGFRVVWRALQPAVVRFLAVYDSRAADDLASETWLQVTRDLSRFHGDAADFRAWLFTIARHRALDWLRAQRRRPCDPVPVEELDVLTDPDETESGVLEAISTRAAIDLVRTLPPDQSEAVALRVIAGLSVDETAALLGKSPGAVRVCAHRGLRALAARLARVAV